MNPRFLAAVLFAAIGSASTVANAEYADDWAKMKRLKPLGYVCTRAAKPILVDGRLDDPAWKAAPWTRNFTDIEGDAKPRPRFRTRAKMLWDDDYFYIAAELEEPHVWGTLTNHDAVIFQDPDFEVFIDPDGDTHEYYEFEMNVLNTGWDLFLKKPYKDGGPALNSWEIPGLKTAVHVQGTLNDPRDRDRGWTLEIALPWRVLGEHAHRAAPPGEGDQWRVDFSRVEWQIEIVDGRYRKVPGTKEANWIWSPPGIIDMHRPERWGYVQFTRQPANWVKFAPDASAPARDALQEVYYAQKDFQKKNHRWAATMKELGLDARPAPGLVSPMVLRATDTGYEVAAEIQPRGGPRQRWRIREDARVWRD